MLRRLAALAAAVMAGVVLGGCSIGQGASGNGEARLTVTRDFGARVIARNTERKVPGGETVMRMLERTAKIDTRYGGRFVQAIEGIRSGSDGGRRRDWFYYVNGIEADVGGADRDVSPNDRVWWDYHDWGAAMRIPAVVGSFPEPFVHGSEGKRRPVRIDCAADAAQACGDVADRLERAGVDASTTAIGAGAGKEVLRLVVGEWKDVRGDAAADQLSRGPAQSGVFARPAPGAGGGYGFALLDERGAAERIGGAGTGLIAATRFQEQQPTWVVTGTDRRGLRAAVALLTPRVLQDRFAVASVGGRPVGLPLSAASTGAAG
jgi:hypothetical protein